MPIPVSRTANSRQASPFCDRRVQTDLHFAALGELDGIAGQIEQDLLQAHAVAHHRIRRLIRHTAGERQSFLAGPHGKDVRDLIQHSPQAERGGFQFQFARLDLGRVQQVVQERQEQVGRPPGGLQAVLDGRVDRLPQRHVDHAQDGVHGRAQFVAHIRQEPALGDVGRLGSPPSLAHLGHVGVGTEPANHSATGILQWRYPSEEPAESARRCRAAEIPCRRSRR